ncbi:MAG TPA: hypothetical protein VFS04_06950 [Alphaproteobacteria bacterium]|nr:hypothetical protein [Alphaproteobacteria bacterium]
MRRLLSVAGCLACCLLLAACSGIQMPERWKTLPEDQRAVIFGTVTSVGAAMRIARAELHFRNVETGESASLQALAGYDTDGLRDLYIRRERIGWFFETALPPGRYEFYKYIAVDSGTDYRSEKDFSVPFTVEAGKTYYLGEYSSMAYLNEGPLWDFVLGGYFRLIDNFERDTALLEKKRGAPQPDVIKQIPVPPAENLYLRTTVAPYGDFGPYPRCRGLFC